MAEWQNAVNVGAGVRGGAVERGAVEGWSAESAERPEGATSDERATQRNSSQHAANVHPPWAWPPGHPLCPALPPNGRAGGGRPRGDLHTGRFSLLTQQVR